MAHCGSTKGRFNRTRCGWWVGRCNDDDSPLPSTMPPLRAGVGQRQMKIFVSGNCQTHQIVLGLSSAGLPNVSVQGLRHGPQSWPGTDADREAARAADVVLTHYNPK